MFDFINKCFRKKNKKNIKPSYDCVKDFDIENTDEDLQLKEELILLIKYFINYTQENPGILMRIEQLKSLLLLYFRNGVIPVRFQQSRYINTEDRLKSVIEKKIHIDNVNLLLECLKKINK